MRFNKHRWIRLSAAVVALSLAAAACGGDDDDDATAGDDGGSEVAGEVIVSGSSTVEPISVRVAEMLEDEAPDVDVTVDGPGTGDGFALFCEGSTDISDASRAIKAEEAATCEANGVEFIELKVGIDGLTVMTNPANDGIECLSFADLYALIGPESQGFESWSDAQALATELGSSVQFPDASLDISGPGEESGTYDSFVELVLTPVAEMRVEAGKLAEDKAEAARPDYQSSGDDNVILQGIEGADSSLGWVGFAYAEEAADQIKEIQVSEEPGGTCVEPNPETIASGDYPISRPLFIYVNKAKAEENPAVAAYVDFYLNDGIDAVADVGYVAITEDEIATTRKAWTDRSVGTRET